MTSYAAIDRFEGEFVVCEVEEIPISKSKPEDYATKPTTMITVELRLINQKTTKINEGDILVVEHENGNITAIYCVDAEEKARRTEIAKALVF